MNQPAQAPLPTSAALEQLLSDAPADSISLGWIMVHLQSRSFGLVMLVLSLLGLAPGIASFSGFFLAIPAIQMMLGRESPVLPGFLARRTIPTRHLARWVLRVIPVFRFIEAHTPLHIPAPAWLTKRFVGTIDLLLAIAIILPLPFAYIPPTLAIALISFAYLEEDGLLLGIAFVAALAAIALTLGLIWSVVGATGLLAYL
ncbi:MAG TPA: exopolysaccharide biosynthesis protein [Rhizomicrobium sp.]